MKAIADQKQAEEERAKKHPEFQPVTQKAMTSITNAWTKTQARTSEQVTAKVEATSSSIENKLAHLASENQVKYESLREELLVVKREMESGFASLQDKMVQLEHQLNQGFKDFAQKTTVNYGTPTPKSPGGLPSESLKGIEKLVHRNGDAMKKIRDEMTQVNRCSSETQALVDQASRTITAVRNHVDSLREQMNRDTSRLEKLIDNKFDSSRDSEQHPPELTRSLSLDGPRRSQRTHQPPHKHASSRSRPGSTGKNSPQ